MQTELNKLQDGTYLAMFDSTALSGLAFLPLEPNRGYWAGREPITAAALFLTVAHNSRPLIVGVWTNPEGEKELDLAEWIANEGDALEFARHYNQRAIWNVAEGCAISV